jgi:hypothetical protein
MVSEPPGVPGGNPVMAGGVVLVDDEAEYNEKRSGK